MKTVRMMGAMTFAAWAAIALSGCVCAPKCRAERGSIIVDSPFDLEIGSTEYAQSFGDLIQTSVNANYDPRTKTTTTNWYHHAEARLATPYFGCERMSLSFDGEEKALERCSLTFSGRLSGSSKKMTYDECRETVGKIVADMEKRLGITMECSSENTEEGAKESVRQMAGRYKKPNEKCLGYALSFVYFKGERQGEKAMTDYSVSGLMSDKGDCSIHISYSKHREISFPSYKPGDKIPVYTNEMYSATSSGLVPTQEQKAAHEAARRLRETINRLFGIDLDTPTQTNVLSSAMWQTNALAAVMLEWMPLAVPFEGLTERKGNQTIMLLGMPFGAFALRRPFDGDVTDEELAAQAQRILARLEAEYGAKIPVADTAERLSALAKMFGEGVPAFGDTKALLGLDKTQWFAGKVGDLLIDISYATPRYAKKGNAFEIVRKGAIVVNIVQSPLITTGKVKGALRPF